MAKIVSSIKAACHQVAGSPKVKIVGLVAAGAGLVGAASAETFNFSILGDLADAMVALVPKANALVDAGGPLVINICIIGAVCAPFVWLFYKAHGKL